MPHLNRTAESFRLALKLFLPSWNFFADFDETIRMDLRVLPPEGSPGEWMDSLSSNPQADTGLTRIFLNTSGNQILLLKSRVERSCERLQEMWPGKGIPDSSELSSSEPYLQLLRIACSQVRRGALANEAISVQFRLVTVSAKGNERVLFTSHWHCPGEISPA